MRKELLLVSVLVLLTPICSILVFAQSQSESTREGPIVIAAVAPVFPPSLELRVRKEKSSLR